ncbi:MAG: discoidin domain-containing protein, partial [Planctomycetes bacterium]|nr:discoidin domain-containing protein [Planctomycetota bacterium]
MSRIVVILTAAGLLALAAVAVAQAADGGGTDATRHDAAGGVDGAKTGNFAFHTAQEDRPWWQVDLGTVQPLDRVVVWNRCSPDSSRARTLEILLSDDGKTWRKVYAHDGTVFHGVSDSKPLTVPMKGAPGRFVRLQLAEQTWLHLDEVEVFGQADPAKNIALRHPADQSSTSEWSGAKQAAAAEPVAAWSPAESPLPPGAMPFDEILFVKRKPYSSDHYYTDIDNGTSGDRFLPANVIYIYNLRTKEERAVVTAAQMPGGKGFIGKISLSFDARKVLFDFRENPGAGFRIWEVGVDGQGLRQVSHPPADEAEKVARWRPGWHTDDIHPNYLPDGRVIFSSTRSEHTVLCGGSSHLVAPTLHRMDADGSHVVSLSNSPVSEFCPVVLNDGRVMYHRWEYIDKGARVGKTVWTMLPDGSKCQEIYGVADDTTTIYMYPQPLPADDGRIVCVGTCHFPQGGCLGAIMIVNGLHSNRARGPDPDSKDYTQWDDRYAVTNLTPHVFVQRRTEPGWHQRTAAGRYVHDAVGRSGHLYTHPWPVSDTQFLVSYKVRAADHYKDVPNAYALYLIDTQGRHWPVHK